MAPAAVTEDYYVVLEVEQTAPVELIVKSYKRLALKRHPDRNKLPNATAAFQLAYDCLKDAALRRAYDQIYPSIRQKSGCLPGNQTLCPTKAEPPPPKSADSRPCAPPNSQRASSLDEANIASRRKSQREREERWKKEKAVFESSISEHKRNVRRLENEIKAAKDVLETLLSDAATAETQSDNNGWNWLRPSPAPNQPEDPHEEKDRKDRERQERTIEKDMKERRLAVMKAELKKEEDALAAGQAKIDVANKEDEDAISNIETRIWKEKARERAESERLAREAEEAVRIARKQQEQWQRQQEAARIARQQEEARAVRQWLEQFEKAMSDLTASVEQFSEGLQNIQQRMSARPVEQGARRAQQQQPMQHNFAFHSAQYQAQQTHRVFSAEHRAKSRTEQLSAIANKPWARTPGMRICLCSNALLIDSVYTCYSCAIRSPSKPQVQICPVCSRLTCWSCGVNGHLNREWRLV